MVFATSEILVGLAAIYGLRKEDSGKSRELEDEVQKASLVNAGQVNHLELWIFAPYSPCCAHLRLPRSGVVRLYNSKSSAESILDLVEVIPTSIGSRTTQTVTTIFPICWFCSI
jgi:hypothetical protein